MILLTETRTFLVLLVLSKDSNRFQSRLIEKWPNLNPLNTSSSQHCKAMFIFF